MREKMEQLKLQLENDVKSSADLVELDTIRVK